MFLIEVHKQELVLTGGTGTGTAVGHLTFVTIIGNWEWFSLKFHSKSEPTDVVGAMPIL